MSQASDWVAKWTDATLPRTDPMGWHVDPPRPHWGIGRLNAIAIVDDDGGLQMEQSSMSPANAMAFARWILDVFSEERSDEAHDGVAPAGSGSRESRTTAGAAWGAPTGEESRAPMDTRGA